VSVLQTFDHPIKVSRQVLKHIIVAKLEWSNFRISIGNLLTDLVEIVNWSRHTIAHPQRIADERWHQTGHRNHDSTVILPKAAEDRSESSVSILQELNKKPKERGCKCEHKELK